MPRWLLVTSLVTISAVEPYANGQTPPAPEAPKFAKVSGVVVDAADGRVLRRATVCITPDSNRHYCNDIPDCKGRFTLGLTLLSRPIFLQHRARGIFCC